MTLTQRTIFIKGLIAGIEAKIIANASNMPEEWDGHELRRYIADTFVDLTGGCLAAGRVRQQGHANRMKAYRNEVLVRNL